MTIQNSSILWFRQDLRLGDNPALVAAVESGQVLPIYIVDDVNAGDAAMGSASRAWLHQSLQQLNVSLQGKLQFFRGDARAVFKQLCAQVKPSAVFWNRCYQPWQIARDSEIKTWLQSQDINVGSCNGSLLWEPWTVSKQDGGPYQVFTPYFQKGCMRAPPPRTPASVPKAIQYCPQQAETAISLEALELVDGSAWVDKVLSHWSVGEAAAQEKLDTFCSETVEDYQRGRDFPALQATSMLSPHLHFGEISPHQIWHRLQQESLHSASEGIAHFRRELGWREFSYHQLYHFPALPHKAFRNKYDRFEWLQDAQGLAMWQQGKTGFPIIDAGMRELWETGYMHNRVRMLVASFLIKNQLIDWRHGAAWFWDCLLEADLASNSASWQWCAGSGADATPYFRIFNPVLQSEKFDPGGEYLLRYCPELKGLPAKYRHKPWEASSDILKNAGIELGKDYPLPILDLKTTRTRALERLKSLG